MNMYKTVLKQIGSLLVLESIIMSLPSLVSLLYKEWYSTTGFLLSGAIAFLIGFTLYRIFRDSDDPHHNQAIIIAASCWLVLSFMGGLPFFIISYITPLKVMQGFIPPGEVYSDSSLLFFMKPLHCIFESVSAFTTTGFTMAVHEPSIGHGLLFYRSLANWVGGAGFIIMVVAVFKQISGRGAILLYKSESSIQKLRPKVIETARVIWKTYFIITSFLVIYLIVGTYLILPEYPICDNIFDSVNHAMSGIATGGFSTLDDSIAGYHSPSMEMLYLLPMILGSFSILFYFKLFRDKKISEFWKDIQTRALLIAFFFGSIILSFLLFYADRVPNPVREGIFQFVSAISTTGWQTSNIGNWDNISILFIVFAAMYVGGASGATVGGIKMIRVLLILKGIRWQVNKVFLSEHTVKSIRFNGRSMLSDEMNDELASSLSYALLFFLMLIGGTIISVLFMGNGFTYSDALFESASAMGTVGLSTGIVGPSMSSRLEVTYIIEMLAGRLEIIPIFALIRALFWGTNP
jgi:trk system potassium uptake protein